MAGDYSRIADGLFRRFSGVLMQQGRVHLDSDWNAQIALTLRRFATQAADTMGPAAVPATTPNGFAITAVAGPPVDFAVGAGRMYVDGLQAEAFAAETFAGKPVSYLNQPFYPQPDPIPAAGLAYLDVWQREVTAVEDPSLPDVALGGVDTTARVQTVWQVKLLGPATGGPAPTCATDFGKQFPPSAGLLSSQAVAPVTPADPCLLPDQAGYRGIENRLYRVQIHTGGNAAAARWKWSRENASVASRVSKVATAAVSTITVDRVGRDAVLRFSASNWVEVTDDRREFMGQAGDMAQIVGTPDQTLRTITLDRKLSVDLDPAQGALNLRVIRWDQSTGVDANGLLPVTSGFVALEDGVQASLEIDTSVPGGLFHIGDFWAFAARTADASVETLARAKPLGPHHHYAALATFTLSGTTLTVTGECRIPWPPPGAGGHDCFCTLCVTAADQAKDAGALAAAVTKLAKSGGRICLGVGIYTLPRTLIISEAANLIISGQGAATVLLHSGEGAAIAIDRTNGLRIEDLSVVTLATASATGAAVAPMAILLGNSTEVAIERVGAAVLAVPPPSVAAPAATTVAGGAAGAAARAGAALRAALVPGATTGPPAIVSMAIALDGFLVECSVRDCVLIADAAIGKLGLLGEGVGGFSTVKTAHGVLLLGGLRLQRNLMLAAQAGVLLADVGRDTTLVLAASETLIEGNRIFGCDGAGIALLGLTTPGGSVRIAGNHLEATGIGVYCGMDATAISGNHITQLDFVTAASVAQHAASLTPTPAIRLVPGPAVQPVLGEVRVFDNRIAGIFGPGIEIAALMFVASVRGNAIGGVVGAGIATRFGAGIGDLLVRDNEIVLVNGPPATPNQPVAGIDVGLALDVVVQDNVVDTVCLAPQAAQNCAGIRVSAVLGASVRGNSLSNLGQVAELNHTTNGIFAESGFGDLTVSNNTVWQTIIAQSTAGQFSAISVHGNVDKPVGSVSVQGNVVEGSSLLPLIGVSGVVDCVLTGNRARRDGATSATGTRASSAIVVVSAGTVIAGDNRIQGEKGFEGLRIDATPGAASPTGAPAPPQATILGNIVAQSIILNGAALAAPSPYALLNVIV